MKYGKKDKNTFEKICNMVYLGIGFSLFSYTGYVVYQNNIKSLFSDNETIGKNIEKIVEDTREQQDIKNSVYFVKAD